MMKRKIIASFCLVSLGSVLLVMNACSEFVAVSNSPLMIDPGVISATSFEKTQQVIQRDCVSCHRTGGSSTSFEFSTPDQYISAGLIVPGRPRQSKLITRMINFNDSTVTTDNMPLGRSAIPGQDYQTIYNWIAEMPAVGMPVDPVDESPFTCTDDTFRPANVAASNAKRLSIRQYSNSLKDLFTLGSNRTTAVTLVDSALAAIELPGDTGTNFTRENNTFGGQHAQGFFDIADRIATEVSTNQLNNFVTQFIALNRGTCTSPNVTSLSADCRDRLINNFASRALRRPLRDPAQNLSTTTGVAINELASLAAEFSGASTQVGVNRLIFRVLLNPHFLFQIEDQNLVQATNLGSNTFMLSPHAFISRLTLRYWNTIPDETLWGMANTENFNSNTGYSNVLNYVISQRAKLDDSIREYMHDWLRLARTPNFGSNPRIALMASNITFNSALRTEMIREVEELGSYVTTSGGSFEDLFLSNVSFARSQNLMRVYNQTTAAPAYMNVNNNTAVRFPANTRAGILTRAAMLISGSELTNPILRGAHLRKDILCLNLGSPPSNALDVFNDTEVPHGITTREKTDIKTSAPDCVGCHNLINPLGFGFSNFDSLGRFIQQEPVFSRTQVAIESYIPVTANVDLTALFGNGATAANAVELSRFVAREQSAKVCFAEKLMSFSMNRTVSRTNDGCRLDKIYTNLNDNDPLIDAIRSTALDMEFRVRKIQ